MKIMIFGGLIKFQWKVQENAVFLTLSSLFEPFNLKMLFLVQNLPLYQTQYKSIENINAFDLIQPTFLSFSCECTSFRKCWLYFIRSHEIDNDSKNSDVIHISKISFPVSDLAESFLYSSYSYIFPILILFIFLCSSD